MDKNKTEHGCVICAIIVIVGMIGFVYGAYSWASNDSSGAMMYKRQEINKREVFPAINAPLVLKLDTEPVQ